MDNEKVYNMSSQKVNQLLVNKAIKKNRTKEENNFLLIDYDNCITNLSASILKKFKVDTGGKTSLPIADKFLNKEYKNVVVILLDALGVNIIDKNLNANGFFTRNMVTEYHSVYPPTTVAATTAFLSGKNPCETGWIGWDCYVPQIDENVEMFTNNKTSTDEPAADINVAWTYFPYENIIEKINRTDNDVAAHMVAPFNTPDIDSIDKLLDRVSELCEEPGNKFIYAYWNEPDFTLHKFGCYGEEAQKVVSKLEERVEAFCDKLEDTLVIITADHGHMNSVNYCRKQFPEIDECLIREISIEPRTLNLFVKEDKKGQFVAEFTHRFGDDFILLSKDEVIEKHIFGTGTEHESFRDILGDYIAIAVGDVSVFNTYEEKAMFVGAHAGLTKDEMMIPLIVIEKK